MYATVNKHSGCVYGLVLDYKQAPNSLAGELSIYRGYGNKYTDRVDKPGIQLKIEYQARRDDKFNRTITWK